MVLVSICIPVYKQKKYLEKCLQSVLMQDFKAFELIITDDTPDDSLETFIASVLAGLNYTYRRNTPSLGAPQNWNLALEMAKGKYIKVMHHDDFFTQPDSLSKMLGVAEEQQADFVFSETDVWYPHMNYNRIHSVSQKLLTRLKSNPDYLFFKNVIGSPSAVLYKNTGTHFYDKQLKWLVDIDFYMSYLQKHHRLAFVKAPLICTTHETEDQLTGTVINDRVIQVKEHVLIYNKIAGSGIPVKTFSSFFEYLFRDFEVTSYQELLAIVPEAAMQEAFYKRVILMMGKGVAWKNFKRKLFKSRYNNYTFKFEQF
jgi:glycosyltransferase involved in cell wall biosynthesis